MGIVRLLSWNVNGIRAVHRKGELAKIFENKPEIVCIQETKANEDQLSAEIKDIEGYQSYFVSAEKKGYSGVAVYTQNSPAKVGNGFGVERFDSEGRVLVAEFKTFTLLNIYYPNGKASKERLKYKLDF